jgi:hypothetical protein
MKPLLPLLAVLMRPSPHAKQRPVKKRKRNRKRTRLQKQQKASRRGNR